MVNPDQEKTHLNWIGGNDEGMMLRNLTITSLFTWMPKSDYVVSLLSNCGSTIALYINDIV